MGWQATARAAHESAGGEAAMTSQQVVGRAIKFMNGYLKPWFGKEVVGKAIPCVRSAVERAWRLVAQRY